jgi:hypothetical protein
MKTHPRLPPRLKQMLALKRMVHRNWKGLLVPRKHLSEELNGTNTNVI